jgi:hypothetical protein
VTLSLINRLGQRVRIMWHTPICITALNRAIAGVLAGTVGAVIGAHGSPVHILAIAAAVGASAGYMAQAILYWLLAILSPPPIPSPVQPVSERRLLAVLDLLPHNELCSDCVELLASNPVSYFLTVECSRCEAIARHRELNLRAANNLRAVVPRRAHSVAYLDEGHVAPVNRHWVA